MKKLHLSLLISVFTLISFSVSPLIFAETPTIDQQVEMQKSKQNQIEEHKAQLREEKQDQIDAYKNQLKEQKQNIVQNRCEKISKFIDNRVENYRNNEDAHINVFNNLVTRVKNLITNLKKAGYTGDNLTKLEGDLVTLEQKVKDFNDTYSTYISELKDTKNFACGESAGDYLTTIKNAQGDLTDLRLAAQDIRSFYIGTIKSDMFAIRQQVASEKTDQNNDDKSTESNN